MQNTDKNEILAIIVLVVLALVTSFLVTSGYYEQNPVIKEVPTISPTKLTVTVVDEIERCQKENGNMHAYTNYRVGDSDKIKTYGSISCDKTYSEGTKFIKETLFDYNF